MFDWIADTFTQAQDLLFQHVVMPLTYAIGLGGYVEDAYPGTEWLLMGLVQIAVLLLVFRPLERWRPVEPMHDRKAVRADVIYTLFHRLGFFPLLMFFTLQPLIDALDGELRFWGWAHLNVEDWWPGVTSIAIVSFLVYLVLFDLLDYWYHRLSHKFHWWWSLHALHHSQQQMTLWSDDRNHIIDDVLRGAVFAIAALVIGVEPSQYVLLVAISQLLQSLQHANVRLHFGWLGERLLISPRFHRLHHAIGLGHEVPGKPGVLGGCNFGVLFPWWDMLFGTAVFSPEYHATGIRDQLPAPQGRSRDYGRGVLRQQWLGIKRLFGRA
ncbi:sterol desaturase family protein [Ralstonia mannitolilytica]|uniref:Fatty acid hydroxylase domain-containing protein n=1 Tax=Ralstonia mannitolilytica TaxID=105219 RepID=A0AAD2B0S0_9RALS|nr:sterol desaturase family protein [Ralstonia mannitolilytica]ATG20159.1 fatty acid hydroxylase [Ralstonia pickettii]ANA34599.1 fatty acid hydroxylase [Ralstonia mannitolilytica]MBY4719284.1 sterol desaturase family protein [Ralstonia mannitolilytica]CAJ0684026.1 hypothetical protein R82526_02327 [Ralstonia mannitolilytica]CAJ0695452.1 hypothetical protein R77591_04421 [Ralstonia mannitolilytica]